MSAVTRWVEYSTTASGLPGDGNGQTCKGTRGYVLATAAVGDSFDVGSTTNRLYLSIDGDAAPYVTIVSGTDLDPRFVARDITEKLHNLGKSNDRYDQAQAVWENNKIKIYSGTLSAASTVTVASGLNTVHLELGFGTKSEVGGVAATNPSAGAPNSYPGGIELSGGYSGFFDEIYRVSINKETNVGTPAKQGGNTYTGTCTVGGVFGYTSDRWYKISIDTANGTTMGGGTGNVPTMSWTSEGGVDDSATAVELLYPDYWYMLGTKGVMVKFTDAVFNTVNPAYQIDCTYADEAVAGNAQAPPGTAKYIWGSNRGDDASVPLVTSSGTPTRLGTRGVYIRFTSSNNFLAGDEFYVICTPPQPQSYDIAVLNYGNVTVSTESSVKSVIFEILSGAVEIDTVKFGLQNHGTFSHHDAGNNDTKFRFGTVGPGNNAGVNPVDGLEWRANVVAADIDADVPPSYLYATKEDLAVVADADASEAIGDSHYMGMVADPMFLNIKLGASEIGANSTINYRIYFDYS